MLNFCFFLSNAWGNVSKHCLQNDFCNHMFWMMPNFSSAVSDSTTLYCTSHECIFCLHHSLHASLYISNHSSNRATLCNIQFIYVYLWIAHPWFYPVTTLLLKSTIQIYCIKKFLLLHCNDKHFLWFLYIHILYIY